MTNEKETKTTTDFKNRDVILNGNVTEESVLKIVEKIIAINNHDDEVFATNPKPIKLIINSYGGSLHDANFLIGIIETSKTPVHTYVYGKAMSAGLYIFSSGHKRYTTKLATFMYHDVSAGVIGTVETMKYGVQNSVALRDRYDNYIASKTKLPKHVMDEKKKMKEDWYITGEEAVGYGLADELIPFR